MILGKFIYSPSIKKINKSIIIIIFSVVKEEVADDDANLPCYNGRVIAWVISTEGSIASDSKSQHSITSDNNNTTALTTQSNINTPIINSNLHAGHTHYLTNNSENNIEAGRAAINSMDNHPDYRKHNRIRDLNDDTTTETESLVSTLRGMLYFFKHNNCLKLNVFKKKKKIYGYTVHHQDVIITHLVSSIKKKCIYLIKKIISDHHLQNHRRSLKMPSNHKVAYQYDASSIMSSELDTTTFFDSENDDQ